jgi:hypothetical protein
MVAQDGALKPAIAARGVRLGYYGEGEEVGLAVALAVAL